MIRSISHPVRLPGYLSRSLTGGQTWKCISDFGDDFGFVFPLILGVHKQLYQSSVRTGSLKPVSENLVPAKVPVIALRPPLTALLAKGAPKAELLL